MATNKDDSSRQHREPQGFGEHTRKPSSEKAHQLGWGLNEDERRRIPEGRKPWEGGIDYEIWRPGLWRHAGRYKRGKALASRV